MSGIRCLAWRGRQRTPSNRGLEAEAKKQGKDGSNKGETGRSITEKPGIHPRLVDLGPGNGDFTLEARLFTTQHDAALMGKMMAKEIYAPSSSPRGGRKMLVIRGGRLSWEVSGQGQLLGSIPIDDGKEHKVSVVYKAREDHFMLYVDDAWDGSGIGNVRDHAHCRWAMGNTDQLPSWSLDASNSRFDTALGAIVEVRWNGKLLQTGSPSVMSKPAYLDGQQVEYYSKTHMVWMRGDMSVKVMASDEGSERALYDVVLQVRRQRRSGVGLSCLRLPLGPGEPCDFYREDEDRWVPARIHSAVMDSPTPMYDVQVEGQAPGDPPIRARAIYVRHRFPKDTRVVVFKGLHKGWVPASVMLDPEEGRQDQEVAQVDPDDCELGAPVNGAVQSTLTVMTRASVATAGPTLPSPRMEGKGEYNWAQVCVCEDGSTAWSAVPAYLVRFHEDFLEQIGKEEALRDYVQQELDALDCSSEPPDADDPANIAGLDDLQAPEKPKKRKTKVKEALRDCEWYTDSEVIAI